MSKLSNHLNYVVFNHNGKYIRNNWYCFKMGLYYGDAESWQNIYKWCEENLKDFWAVNGDRIYIKNREDATAFKLTYK